MRSFITILFFAHLSVVFSQTRNNQRTEEEAKTLVDTLYQKLMRGENFERLAILYSDDKSVQRNNGEIGWTSAGVLVKEYEDMANSLKPGEISVPFKSQFGYHIVQLEEKEESRIKTRHILIAFRD